jgi:hypothetical protein
LLVLRNAISQAQLFFHPSHVFAGARLANGEAQQAVLARPSCAAKLAGRAGGARRPRLVPRRPRAGVDAQASEVVAEARLEEGARGRVEWLAG